MAHAIHFVCRKAHGLSGLFLALMMTLTAADVGLRYLANHPISGATELNELMLVLVVFFGMAYTQVQKRHIRIELMVSRLSATTRTALNIISDFTVFFTAMLIAWQGLLYAVQEFRSGLTTVVLYIPVWPVIVCLALGAMLFAAAVSIDFFTEIRKAAAKGFSIWNWFATATALLGVCLGIYLLFSVELNPTQAGTFALLAMLLLLFTGIPIGVVMGLVGAVGMAYLTSTDAGLGLMKTVPFATSSSYVLCVVPLFILMGSFAFQTGLSNEIYNVVYKWLGHFPGGLAMATIGGCAGFAAICGSSLATAATMGTVALPEMQKKKYDNALATGCIAAGGSIGILIPPSTVLVIYGILANQPIGELFIAGIIPGILQAAFYICTIALLCRINPLKGPRGESTSLQTKVTSLKDTWEVMALFLLVMGGLYFGVFTPTEAAGVGAFGAFFITLVRKKLNLKNFKASLDDTAMVTSMVFIIVIGAMILSYFFAVTRIPFDLSAWVAELPLNRYIILIMILVIYMLLGCIMDTLPIVLLTIPIFFPVITNLGFDPIWFGIITVRVSELGLITPPIGMNVFVLKGITEVEISTIFRGIIPFLAADVLHLTLLVAFPAISLFLVELMR